MTDVRKFTRKEVGECERDRNTQTVFVIDNVVYDVHAFLEEHPGGHEVLVNAAGTDASEEFHDVSHSFDAKQLMRKYAVGELVHEDRVQPKGSHTRTRWEDAPSTAPETALLTSWKFPLVAGVLLTLLYTYLFG